METMTLYNLPKHKTESCGVHIVDCFSSLKSLKIDRMHSKEQAIIIQMPFGKIDFYDNYNLSQEDIERVNRYGLYIYLNEPVNSYRKDSLDDYMFAELPSDVDIEKLRAYELDVIHKFVCRNNLSKVTVRTCDYNLNKYYAKQYPNFKIECWDIFVVLQTRDMCFSDIRYYSNKTITNRFISATWRYSGARLVINSILMHHDNMMSWFFESEFDQLKDIEWLNLNDKCDLMSKIETGTRLLHDRAPLCLDIKTINPTPRGEILPQNTNQEFINHPLYVNEQNEPLFEFYQNTFVDVVSESRYAQPSANFSEKILRPIKFCTPFILCAPPKTLEYIKKCGFKTYDLWWDESYDDEENHYERLKKINAIIEYISTLSYDELNDIYQEMLPTIKYNFRHLRRISSTHYRIPIL